jgi:hypothetical protein
MDNINSFVKKSDDLVRMNIRRVPFLMNIGSSTSDETIIKSITSQVIDFVIKHQGDFFEDALTTEDLTDLWDISKCSVTRKVKPSDSDPMEVLASLVNVDLVTTESDPYALARVFITDSDHKSKSDKPSRFKQKTV